MHPDGTNEVVDKGTYKAWGRTKAYQVDQKLKSFSEDMHILCADEINMDVDVKVLMSFSVNDEERLAFVREKVPHAPVENSSVAGELSLDKFYTESMSDIVRASSRIVVSSHTTEEVRANREKLEGEIDAMVRKRIVEDMAFPVAISAVTISNLDYPPEVTAQRKKIKEAELADQLKAAEAEALLAEKKRIATELSSRERPA